MNTERIVIEFIYPFASNIYFGRMNRQTGSVTTKPMSNSSCKSITLIFFAIRNSIIPN